MDHSQPEARQAEDQRRQRAVAENLKAASPVVQELRAAGFPVEHIADLFNRKMDYRRAITILLRWLPLVDNKAVKQDIVRALSVKWARPSAAKTLVDEFLAADSKSDGSLKWAIGNALSVVADDTVFDDLVAIACDQAQGRAREMVVVALGNMRDPRAAGVLMGLLDDQEVAGHAIIALGKLRPSGARQRLERFLGDPRAWVRTEARRAVAKIDRTAQDQ